MLYMLRCLFRGFIGTFCGSYTNAGSFALERLLWAYLFIAENNSVPIYVEVQWNCWHATCVTTMESWRIRQHKSSPTAKNGPSYGYTWLVHVHVHILSHQDYLFIYIYHYEHWLSVGKQTSAYTRIGCGYVIQRFLKDISSVRVYKGETYWENEKQTK